MFVSIEALILMCCVSQIPLCLALWTSLGSALQGKVTCHDVSMKPLLQIDVSSTSVPSIRIISCLIHRSFHHHPSVSPSSCCAL